MTTTTMPQEVRAPSRRPPAVALDGLTKRYGHRVVVDRLTLEIPTGVVAGFVGPNGAGKTTTMAMLLGLVRPSAGGGLVLGHGLDHPEAYLGGVGALIEGPAFWPALTGAENLRVVAALGGHDRGRVPGALALVGLAERGGDRYREYSLGMKQRLSIAAAMLGEPALLVLDEPTNGLDPAGIADMRRLVGALAGGDRTVLVSSHILSELEQVCDWLVVIDRGRLVYQGPTSRFLSSAATTVLVAPEHPGDLKRLTDLVRSGGHDPEPDGTGIVVPVNGDEPRALAAVLNRAAGQQGIVLAELHVRRPTLESHYLSMVEGGHR